MQTAHAKAAKDAKVGKGGFVIFAFAPRLRDMDCSRKAPTPAPTLVGAGRGRSG